MRPNVELSCTLIPTDKDGRVLVARRSDTKLSFPGRWETIGDGAHPGESPEECIRREIHEELGCEIAHLLLIDANVARGTDTTYVNFIHTGVLDGEIHLNHEIAELAWIDEHDLHDREWFPTCKEKLLRFMRTSPVDEQDAESKSARLRVDNGVVKRNSRPWTESVHGVLRHLEISGFPAPRVVGEGVDADGIETVTYLAGAIQDRGSWSDANAKELGSLLRRLHETMREYVVPQGAVWQSWSGRTLGDSNRLIGHCDLGPWNVVTVNGRPHGFFDWEYAGPVDPVVELAQLCWLNAKFHDPVVSEIERLPPVESRLGTLRAMVDGYELPVADRAKLIQYMIEVATVAAAGEAEFAGVRPDGAIGASDEETMWAIAWRTRSAATMIEHRRKLVDAIM